MFTTVGFFSVTVDSSDKSTKPRLQVRARIAEDLSLLRSSYLPELSATVKLPGRDYPYRAYCSKEEFGGAMVQLSMALDYSNFKSEVVRVQGLPREQLYARVWSVMSNAETEIARLTAENKKWKAREKDGWFNDNAPVKAKRTYDRNHGDAQVNFDSWTSQRSRGTTSRVMPSISERSEALFPEDAMDPFKDIPLPTDFDMQDFAAQLKELRSSFTPESSEPANDEPLPSTPITPSVRKRKGKKK